MIKSKTKLYAYLFATTFLLSGGVELFIDSTPAYAGKGKKAIIDGRDETRKVGLKRSPEEIRDEDEEESSEKAPRVENAGDPSSSLSLVDLSSATSKKTERETSSNYAFIGFQDEDKVLEPKPQEQRQKRTRNQYESSPDTIIPEAGSLIPVFADNADGMGWVCKAIQQVPEEEVQGGPLVSVMGRELKSHSLLEDLGEDISLANDLAYAIGKRYIVTHFLYDQNLKADQRKKLEAAYVRYNERAKEVLDYLKNQGWRLALKTDKQFKNVFEAHSIIKGKSGSVNSGFINNQPGIVLFHKKTGTLLPVFHGSRGDDFLPVSHDWYANLDIELHNIKLDEKTSARAHRGFAMTAEYLKDSLHSIILTSIQQRNTVKRIVFTGHSHGAAISSQACLNAIRELGPKFEIDGTQFKNPERNLFCHYGLSEPAGIHEDDIDKVREFVGRDNFLSVGARHDPVMLLFRGQFWETLKQRFSPTLNNEITEDPTKHNFEALRSVLVMAKQLMPSSKWMDILKIAAAPEKYLRFAHVGHLALEPYQNLLQRVMSSRPINVMGILSAVHYGGIEGNFDPRIGNPRFLDFMLNHAQASPLTVQEFIEEINGIVSNGAQVIGRTVARAVQAVERMPRAQQVVAGIAGGMVCYRFLKDLYNKDDKKP